MPRYCFMQGDCGNVKLEPGCENIDIKHPWSGVIQGRFNVVSCRTIGAGLLVHSALKKKKKNRNCKFLLLTYQQFILKGQLQVQGHLLVSWGVITVNVSVSDYWMNVDILSLDLCTKRSCNRCDNMREDYENFLSANIFYSVVIFTTNIEYLKIT